ncbi:MAG: tRNA-intron lyase [Candidatus Nitrosoabyssus spongiisocia]|nr:MAG: tRNA-intron lyase [Nitrosopumilaceae archaeon AB1(1)]
MQSEDSKVNGILKNNKIIISDIEMQKNLQQRGFGKIIDGKIFKLEVYEALYLIYRKTLKVTSRNVEINFDSMMKKCVSDDKEILIKFLIYRDLRTRGYIVQDGFGAGIDFRVYEQGEMGKSSSKYVVFAFSEGSQEKIGILKDKIKNITQMGKEAIIAMIDRRGELIYYKVSPMNFHHNK